MFFLGFRDYPDPLEIPFKLYVVLYFSLYSFPVRTGDVWLSAINATVSTIAGTTLTNKTVSENQYSSALHDARTSRRLFDFLG